MAYTAPTVRDLVARYPAFAAVPISTVELYLTDALASIDESWVEVDYIPGACALAAHNMAVLGLDTKTEVETYVAQGITRVRSGNFDLQISDAVAARVASGGYDATPYGRAFKLLRKRNRGGPRIVTAGHACVPGF